MTLTEQEAATKWCVRAMGRNSNDKCLTSACMAWRWAKKLRVDVNDQVVGEDNSSTHGYCGLAGEART